MLDQDSKLLYKNDAFEQLSHNQKNGILTHVVRSRDLQSEVFEFGSKLIRRILLEEGTAFLVASEYSKESVSERTLREITAATTQTENIYFAAAQAIFKCLSWRWVVITRFTTPARLEVLAFLDNGQRVDEYEYDVAGTPCERVVNTNRFTMYSDVSMAFPNYSALEDIGAKTYAGLIYRGTDNQPLGHVMAMHDDRDVDFTLSEDVIGVATIALSSHFQLLKTTSQLREVEVQAKVDCLTNIGNRSAYQDKLNEVSQFVESKPESNWTVAIVDLDNLKPLNDERGHDAGDRFIQLIASELSRIGRVEDHAFRIGGDEFAVIFSQSTPTFTSALYNRFEKIIERVRLALDFHIDASIGCATVSEVEGNVNACIKLADERMYKMKHAKRKFLGKIK
ncbi:GGDEF domain-containing protein [Alteromonadaceae bacterium M269]|nr:GGDEF domain-containing protein [Alteromonadaceae bacterium M269]